MARSRMEKPTEPKKLRDHVILEIAKHGLEEEANNHKAPPKSMNGCCTTGL